MSLSQRWRSCIAVGERAYSEEALKDAITAAAKDNGLPIRLTVKRDTVLRVMFDETLRRLQDFDFLIRVSEFANCAATDQVLWIKYWDAGAISAEDNMISANIELVRRHRRTQLLDVREVVP